MPTFSLDETVKKEMVVYYGMHLCWKKCVRRVWSRRRPQIGECFESFVVHFGVDLISGNARVGYIEEDTACGRSVVTYFKEEWHKTLLEVYNIFRKHDLRINLKKRAELI